MKILVPDMNCKDHLAIEEEFRKSCSLGKYTDEEMIKRCIYVIGEKNGEKKRNAFDCTL